MPKLKIWPGVRTASSGQRVTVFANLLYHFGIQDEWFAFREEEYKRAAIEWCQDNNIEYIEE